MSGILTQDMLIADMHVHSLLSEHAYSTLKENTDTAYAKGLKFMALTDHFYQPEDNIALRNRLSYMMDVNNIPLHNNLVVIPGVEGNLNQILRPEVNIYKLSKRVRWRLIGLHSWFVDIPNCRMQDILEFYKQAVVGKNKGGVLMRPTAFAHIERNLFKCYDYELEQAIELVKQIVDIAVENSIYLEINENSLYKNDHDTVSILAAWLTYAKSIPDAKFSMGTDAHFCEQVGNFELAINLVNDVGIAPERILNTNEDELQALVAK